MTVEQWLGKDNQLGIDIWNKKYRNGEETFDEWLDRVSGGKESVRNLIIEKKFLFGGRILANRGVADTNKLTYSNCYVVAPPEDNIESIFDCAKKLARTYSYGGGCGIDISKLAPKGSKVNNAARESSGAVSFMDLYSMITGLISQQGRRGALMISMSCDHPDIEDFIDIKKDLDRVTKANISVRMTDDFLRSAYNKNKEVSLVFKRGETGEKIEKTVKPYSIMMKLAQNNWDMGEPGVLFWDRIENYNLLSKYDDFHYAGTNPCAEEPLPAGGSCLLGSLNLSEFVTNEGNFDFDAFSDAVVVATMALNDVLDEGIKLHPLYEQRQSVSDWRQIGLGIFGLADMLIKMGITYGSEEAIAICENIGEYLINYALMGSANMAAITGKSFPKYDYEKISGSNFYKANVWTKVDEAIRNNGLHNSQLLTIAPTGTLSTMIGVSGGIEPIFANYYEHKTESLHGEDVYYKVYTPIVKAFMEENGITDDKELPEYFITSSDLEPAKRVKMQAVWQKHIDASISSTVNLPETATVDDIYNIYMNAWENGLKGITVFRSNCSRAAILSTTPKKTNDSIETNDCVKLDRIKPISRKTMGTTHGSTFCKKCACGTLYITVNRDNDGNLVETFVETSKGGICRANISAVNRLISLSMRSGVKIEEIIDQIKGIDCPACTKVKSSGKSIDGLSCPDIIARTIAEMYAGEQRTVEHTPTKQESEDTCPECCEPIRRDGGCVTCPNCGWSRCG